MLFPCFWFLKFLDAEIAGYHEWDKAHGVTWVTRIAKTSCKTFVMPTFFSMSSEIGSILVICFLGKEYKLIKNFWQSTQEMQGEGKGEEKNRIAIAKLFVFHGTARNIFYRFQKAFFLSRKRWALPVKNIKIFHVEIFH